MSISINGRDFDFSPGQTVLDVALKNDIYVPHLCYHQRTGKAGKCRACVVEVEGMKGLQTSCNLPARDGMVVRTDTELVLDSQRTVVDLILSSGHHDCLSCEQNGHCELQDAAYYLGIERPSYNLATEEIDIDQTSEFIYIDRSKCISCGRCVAGCTNTVVNDVLNFADRGFETHIAFDNDIIMGESTCVQCGECLQLCPVGAIIDKRSIGSGRNWELDKVETVCPYCGVGCRLELQIDRKKNKIIRINGVEDSQTNEGMLCVKGRFGFDFVSSDERITSPMIKENGTFRKADWDEAVDFIGKRLKEIKKEHGADSIVGLASAKVTNEENFLFQKFMRREIGTNNVDHCARL